MNNPDLTINPDSTIKINPVQVTTYASIKAGDGLAIDASGSLFAANYAKSEVYKIDTNQTLSPFMNNQPGAAGLVFDKQGTLYLARYSNSDIVKVDSSGTILNVFATGVGGTISLDFDSNEFLYTNNNYNNALTKIDIDGNKEFIYTSAFNNSSLTLDDNHNIYVSDYTSGVIKKLESNTFQESVFTTLPILEGGIGYIIYSHGSFFASAIADNLIFMIDKKGNYKKIAGIQGKSGINDGTGDTATFDKPNAMVTSADGKTLFVAQQGNQFGIRKIIGFKN